MVTLLFKYSFYAPHGHRTTLAAPEKLNNLSSQDARQRRNLYRNQIDYIIKKSQERMLIETSTDQKLVKVEMKII